MKISIGALALVTIAHSAIAANTGDTSSSSGGNAGNQKAGNGNKHLVLFAGPNKAGAETVEMFFRQHASGYNDAEISPGLNGWLWPTISNRIGGSHHVFDKLVTMHTNETVQETLMQGISVAWKKASKGIVVGSEEFDKSRKGIYHGQGLEAMKRVITHLGLPKDRVTVVLHYRTPRIDQWVSIWRHMRPNKQMMDYDDYICAEDRRGALETAMNPLELASLYREQGWKVRMVDMGGVLDNGLDLAHVLACDVLDGTTCQDGWVKDKMHVDYHENYEEDKVFDELPEAKKSELELLFRDRDCHFKNQLESDEGFSVLYDDTVWKGCKPSKKEYYEQLVDTNYLLDQIRSQVGCGKKDVESSSNHDSSPSKVSQKSKIALALGLGSVIANVVFVLVIALRKRNRRKKMQPKFWNEAEWVYFDEAFRIIENRDDWPGKQPRPKNPEIADAIRDGRSVRGMNTPTTPRGTNPNPNLAPLAFNSMFDGDLEDVEII